jgi:aminoglycoside phosphotransferase (APT) family kinase protein
MSTDLDEIVLLDWLETHVAGFSGPITVEKFAGGQSNPTYRISAASGAYVLRRQPFGALLPSAHAVNREYRLLRALWPTGFPSPRPFALCDDPRVIGSMFYVMELVGGRIFWNGALPDQSVAERRDVYQSMITTLANLHTIDPNAIGLQDFGRPGNFFTRQVERWTKQYRASQTEQIDAMERLISWLPRTAPAQTASSIIHGDYRIDNLIYAPDKPSVVAVIDWELATIGDPLADFAYVAMNWVMPADGRSGLLGTDLDGTGIPSMDDVVALYSQATGRADIPNLHWYFAYNLFRLAGIVQGVKKRMLDGNASSAAAGETAARLIPLAEAAWEQACLAGARTSDGNRR